MPDTNPYPVDSTTRTCCGGIGGHSRECVDVLEDLEVAEPTSEFPEYVDDPYDRLRNCAEEFASGAAFPPDAFLDADMLRAFAQSLIDARVLDGLSDHDANTVIMLSVLDFSRGVVRMAWRLTDWLSDHRSVTRHDDDEIAVIAVLARVLAITAAAFVSEEFEIAQQHFPPPEQGAER